MSVGLADRQGNLLDDMEPFCDRALPECSVYPVLHRERDRRFPDELCADLVSDEKRCAVPPSVVATEMVLQRLEGRAGRCQAGPPLHPAPGRGGDDGHAAHLCSWGSGVTPPGQRSVLLAPGVPGTQGRAGPLRCAARSERPLRAG